MLHAHFMAVALCFIEPALLPTEVLHVAGGNRDFPIFDLFPHVTLTLTRLLSYTNLTRIPSRYTGCAKVNFLLQSVRKLSFDRQTDREIQPKLDHATSRGSKTRSSATAKSIARSSCLVGVLYDISWQKIC